MALPPELITPRDHRHGSKLGDVIRRLSSENDGEAIAAVHAMRRILKEHRVDMHDLAAHVENPANGNALTEAEMKKIYEAGFASGVQVTENKHHGAADFINTDGKPNWDAVAVFLQRNKHRLDPKHHEFIDDMASRTVWGREPTEKQHKYLHSLFFKLGGKIT
jgi:hypothetical protein